MGVFEGDWIRILIMKQKGEKKVQPHVYKSKGGTLILGNSIELLGKNEEISALKGKVNLIVTSPPFPLNNKKKVWE